MDLLIIDVIIMRKSFDSITRCYKIIIIRLYDDVKLNISCESDPFGIHYIHIIEANCLILM